MKLTNRRRILSSHLRDVRPWYHGGAMRRAERIIIDGETVLIAGKHTVLSYRMETLLNPPAMRTYTHGAEGSEEMVPPVSEISPYHILPNASIVEDAHTLKSVRPVGGGRYDMHSHWGVVEALVSDAGMAVIGQRGGAITSGSYVTSEDVDAMHETMKLLTPDERSRNGSVRWADRNDGYLAAVIYRGLPGKRGSGWPTILLAVRHESQWIRLEMPEKFILSEYPARSTENRIGLIMVTPVVRNGQLSLIVAADGVLDVWDVEDGDQPAPKPDPEPTPDPEPEPKPDPDPDPQQDPDWPDKSEEIKALETVIEHLKNSLISARAEAIEARKEWRICAEELAVAVNSVHQLQQKNGHQGMRLVHLKMQLDIAWSALTKHQQTEVAARWLEGRGNGSAQPTLYDEQLVYYPSLVSGFGPVYCEESKPKRRPIWRRWFST